MSRKQFFFFCFKPYGTSIYTEEYTGYISVQKTVGLTTKIMRGLTWNQLIMLYF